ncbi:hypothetical protein NKH81_14310 [Mesorhizobium sp. M0959]|uniref:SMODS domain-containing nucleotidyltransferase n=1 Tax=Mesorhizobium sp. M0959 TaxID=2957034 RepID=UPI00333C8942
MELKPQFREFLTSIRPTDKQKEDWRVGSSTLRSRLAEDEELGPQIVTTFLQGSVRRSTAIRAQGDKRPDVDVVVVTTIDPTSTTPTRTMNRFIPFLDKFYKDKWRPQGRSFGIELSYVDIDLVVTALPPDLQSRNFMESLYRSQSVNSLITLEEQPDWRLNRNWVPGNLNSLSSQKSQPLVEDAPESEWKPNPLLLPDRDVGSWGRTHPLAQIQWTASKNRACNGCYVDIVRSLKWWRQTNSDSLPKYPKGYPLEHMIGYSLQDNVTSVGAGIVQVLERMTAQWAFAAELGTVPNLSDHGVPEHNVLKRLSIEDFKAFHKAAGNAAGIARDALDNDDAQESGKLWQRLFGSRFPLPGPGGGDRVGFSQPSRPAEPKDARFA